MASTTVGASPVEKLEAYLRDVRNCIQLLESTTEDLSSEGTDLENRDRHFNGDVASWNADLEEALTTLDADVTEATGASERLTLALTAMAETVLTGRLSALGEALATARDDTEALTVELAQEAETVETAGFDALAKAEDGVTASMDTVESRVDSAAGELGGHLDERAGTVADELREAAVDPLASAAAAMMEGPYIDANTEVEATEGFVSDTIRDALSEAVADFADGVVRSLEAAATSAGEVAADLEEEVEEAVTEARATCDTLSDALSQAMVAAAEDAVHPLSEEWDQATEGLASSSDKLSDWGSLVPQLVAAREAVKAISDLVDSMSS